MKTYKDVTWTSIVNAEKRRSDLHPCLFSEQQDFDSVGFCKISGFQTNGLFVAWDIFQTIEFLKKK